MIELNQEQIDALKLLQMAVDKLADVVDEELDEILEDLGYLPSRDPIEMSDELIEWIKRGEIGYREEFNSITNAKRVYP